MIAEMTERWTKAKVEHLQFYIFPGGYSAHDTAKAGCWFDVDAAWQAVNFGPRFLQHVKGAKGGEPLELEEWQAAILAAVFGWKRKNGKRRFRTAYIEVPRGNGKSTLCIVIVGVLLYIDDEAGADIFSAAGTREQAREVFGPFKLNILRNPDLNSSSQCYQNSVTRIDPDTGVPIGVYKAISADADFQHGGSPHGIIFDELHVQPNRDLWDVLHTGKIKRSQPLTVAITTAGFDRHSICWEQHVYAERIRDGIIKEDDEFLPVIYAAETDDDWTDPETWRKANPNLGVSISEEDLAKEIAKAQEIPAYENTVKRLHLNIWTEQDVRAIPMDKWDACGKEDGWAVEPVMWRAKQLKELLHQPCVAGLDLGSTGDLTALVLLFGDCKPFTLLPFFWIPEDSARKREKRDRVPYPQWIDQGFIFPTGGTTTDYDKVRKDINALADDYGIKELAVDRLFQGQQLCTQLGQDGLPVQAFGQSFLMFAAPTKWFLELIVSDGIRHGNNPVLRWMAANAATDDDAHGNLKFDKKKSLERIDGIVASVMALGRVALAEDGGYWNPSDGVSL